MVNVARNKGKIAAVIAHGGPHKDPATGKEELMISPKRGEAKINDLITDLAHQKNPDGNQRYRLIYFNACNETGVPINMGSIDNPILIPVITYTDVNKGTFGMPGKLKVYWPPQVNFKARTASLFKR